MAAKLTLEEIFAFWTESARTHGDSHHASWSDRSVMELEIETILRYVNDGDFVLDIGCANGWSSVRWAAARKVRVRGLDYIPEMVETARARLAQVSGDLKGEIEFDQGNMMKLAEPDDTFDKVVSIRTVINLGDWERQRVGLSECARVLKPGGLFLLSEATVQGWKRLNDFRAEWGLDAIGMPSFNDYLDRGKVVDALSASLDLVEVVDFASTYYVATRVLKPLLAKALGAKIDVSDPEMEWNRWWATLPQTGDYGTQKLFVFRKR